jgi:hypothetical protein
LYNKCDRFLPRMKKVSGKFVEKTKTHLLSSITFPENHSTYEKMWKNLVGPDWPQVTIYSKHAHFMLDNQGCRHTFVIFKTYRFFTVTMFTRKRLNITLYLQTKPITQTIPLTYSCLQFWPLLVHKH